MAEVAIAIVSLVGQVLAAVDKVVVLLDRLQHVPKLIREFNNLLSQLQDDFADLVMDAKGNASSCFRERQREEIINTLEGCKTFFKNYESTLSDPRIFGGVRRAFWPAMNGLELERYIRDISDLYVRIIIPVLMRLNR
jgi:hypothetical protein